MPPPYKKAAVTNKKKSPQKNQTAPSHSHNQRKSPRNSCGSGSLPPPESGISSSGQINGNTNPPIVNASDAPTNEAHTTDHASGNTTTPPPPLFYGTNPDLESFYRDRHRLAYNEAAFAVANAEVAAGKKDNRVCKQQHELQCIIDCVSYWNKMDSKVKDGTISDSELKEFKDFKKKKENKPGSKWRTHYHTEEVPLPDNNMVVVTRRLETRKVGTTETTFIGRILVSQEESFERIAEHHLAAGHLGQEMTYTNCNVKYYNLTQDMVKSFCRTCPTCLEDNPIIPQPVGAAKPIYSQAFRDRFQVDLIDMRKFACLNVYGVEQNWLMNVKDHYSKLSGLMSLPKKKAKYVAFELDRHFGLVGYPLIFHTDNGNEFVARQILDMLAEINPLIITVTGCPRTPRDQGSVERSNQMVKRILLDMCAQRRKEGKDDNWTMLLGQVTAQLNSHRTRQANSVEAYKLVFGTAYHLPILTSFADARKCKTIGELQHVLADDDGHLKTYVMENYDTERQYTVAEDKQLKEQQDRFWIEGDIEDESDVLAGKLCRFVATDNNPAEYGSTSSVHQYGK